MARPWTTLGAVGALGLGCGPDAPETAVGGTRGDDTTVASSSGGTTQGIDEGSSSGASGGVTCVESDAPPPFCHREFSFEPGEDTDVAGVHAQVIDGVRPVLLIDNDADQWALVDPRDVGAVYVQGVIPTDLQPVHVTFATADLTHDGVADFVFFPADVGDDLIVVLDGVTHDEVAVLAADPMTNFHRSVGFMDANADGKPDLVVADDRNSASSIVEAWSLADGTFSKVFSFDTGIDYRGAGWPRLLIADVDGDSIVDFSNAWPIGAEYQFDDSEPTITTLVGPSTMGSQPVAVESHQPFFAAEVDVADMDGDGDAEILIAENASEIHVLDWSGAQLVATQILGLGEGYAPGVLGLMHAGRLAANGLGGVFVGGVQGTHNNMGATFVIGVEPRFAEQDARLVADFNDDGIDDFWTRDGLMYLSNPVAP